MAWAVILSVGADLLVGLGATVVGSDDVNDAFPAVHPQLTGVLADGVVVARIVAGGFYDGASNACFFTHTHR